MIYTAFPSLAENLTPIVVAYGLDSLEFPSALEIQVLDTTDLVEKTLESILMPLDDDKNNHLCVSIDTEWNLSRRVGVSIIQIAPHSEPNTILIIPVCRAFYSRYITLTMIEGS